MQQLQKELQNRRKWTQNLQRFERQLRIKGDEVETTKGANVPLSHAVRLLKMIVAREAKAGERVGLFNLETIKQNEQGDTIIKIGCHEIALSEAMRVLGHLI